MWAASGSCFCAGVDCRPPFDGDGALAVIAARRRGLAVVDPEGRELTISCGAALGFACIALRYFGHTPEVILHPEPDAADVLARIRVSGARPRTTPRATCSMAWRCGARRFPDRVDGDRADRGCRGRVRRRPAPVDRAGRPDAAALHREIAAGSPAIGILHTTADTADAWLDTGRASGGADRHGVRHWSFVPESGRRVLGAPRTARRRVRYRRRAPVGAALRLRAARGAGVQACALIDGMTAGPGQDNTRSVSTGRNVTLTTIAPVRPNRTTRPRGARVRARPRQEHQWRQAEDCRDRRNPPGARSLPSNGAAGTRRAASSSSYAASIRYPGGTSFCGIMRGFSGPGDRPPVVPCP